MTRRERGGVCRVWHGEGPYSCDRMDTSLGALEPPTRAQLAGWRPPFDASSRSTNPCLGTPRGHRLRWRPIGVQKYSSRLLHPIDIEMVVVGDLQLGRATHVDCSRP